MINANNNYFNELSKLNQLLLWGSSAKERMPPCLILPAIAYLLGTILPPLSHIPSIISSKNTHITTQLTGNNPQRVQQDFKSYPDG